MQLTAARPKIMVSADGTGIVSQAGALLLVQTLRFTGLDHGLSAALGRWRAPRAVHDPGKIIADLSVRWPWAGTAWPMSRCSARNRSCPGRWPPTRSCPG